MTRVRAYFPKGHELEGVVAARGYEYWRSAFVMHIDLDESLDPPLYDRGLRRAGLGVDAKNVTGALRLYENAGMHRANGRTTG